MSMSEERIVGELPEPRMSSLKMALAATGVVIGLGLLVCGGVAGYVAWTTTDSSAPPEDRVPPEQDPANIRDLARRIVAIDIPAGFEPINSEQSQIMNRVVFGRKGADGALLKLARIDLSQVPAGADPSQAAPMMLEMLQIGSQSDTTSIAPDAASPGTTRELTVLGQPATFHFLDGTLPQNGTPVKKVSGAFRTRNAHIALIYMIPKAEYDDDAFLKMIESIRPPSGDSAPEEEASTGQAANGGGDESAKSQPAVDAKPGRDGTPRPADGQGASP
ncbi:MAG: hypothetical protein ACM3U2_21480 [Deltaproteobacteria bacterium]